MAPPIGDATAGKLVRAGMACAFIGYSGDTVEQEKAAIVSRACVHAQRLCEAWDWRAQGPRGLLMPFRRCR